MGFISSSQGRRLRIIRVKTMNHTPISRCTVARTAIFNPKPAHDSLDRLCEALDRFYDGRICWILIGFLALVNLVVIYQVLRPLP